MRALLLIIIPGYGGMGLLAWGLYLDWKAALVAGVGMFLFMFVVNVTAMSGMKDKVLLWKQGEGK